MQLTNRAEEFPGFFPTVLWVGIGVFLFWTTPGASFLSWQAILYFVLCTICVGIFFSFVALTLQRLIPLLKPRSDRQGKPAQMAQLLGTIVGAAQMVLIYLLAKTLVTMVLFAPTTA